MIESRLVTATETAIGALHQRLPNSGMWTRAHPERHAERIGNFDDVVGLFNSLYESNIPVSFMNTRVVQSALRAGSPSLSVISLPIPLPTIDGLLRRCTPELQGDFSGALQEMGEMLDRGAIVAKDPSLKDEEYEPYLRYHKDLKYKQGKVIATTFHLYETLLLRPRVLGEFLPAANFREKVSNALIEVLSLDRRNPLYEHIYGKNRMDWVNGWDGFDPKFRKDNGLE